VGQTYLLRALKLEVTASGSYFNLSQGVFQNAAGSFGPPDLAIAHANGGTTVTLSWPATMLGYHLESAGDLNGNWTAAVFPVQTNLSDRIATTVPMGGESRFFRLREP
jgi:hypothetical protein